MINKVTFKEEPSLFEDITEFSIYTDENHRRGSSYFRWDIIELKEKDKKYFEEVENFEQYLGTWKTNTYIDDHEHGTDEGVSILERVEKKEVISYEWVKV